MQERPSAPREVTMRRWAPSRTPSHAECAEAVEIDHRHREARCRGGVVRLGLEMRAVEHPDEQAPDDIAAIGGPGVVERGRIDALGPQAAQIMGEQRTFPASPVDEVESGDQKIADVDRSEEHTSELQSLMRISYAVFCLKKKNNN